MITHPKIVPTLCVGTLQWTLCVRFWDAGRPGLHSHSERGNDHEPWTAKEAEVAKDKKSPLNGGLRQRFFLWHTAKTLAQFVLQFSTRISDYAFPCCRAGVAVYFLTA